MDSKALVSIIVPNYNKEKYILETLDSINNQTYTNWECIIVDDGSSDNSLEIIKKYIKNKPKFNCFCRDRLPKGAATCRNIGVEKSNGEYIVFLDSDDLLSSTCLENRYKKILAYSGYDLWTYPMLLFNKQINDLNLLSNIKTDEDVLNRFLKRDQLWLMTGPIWKKESFLKIGGFDEALKSQQDLEIHARAITMGLRFKYFDKEPDSYYRQDIINPQFRKDKAYTLDQMQSYVYLIFKLYRCLVKYKRITNERKLILKMFLFWVLKRWSWFFKSNPIIALILPQQYWLKAALIGLISTKELIIGGIYYFNKTLLLDKRIHLKKVSDFLKNIEQKTTNWQLKSSKTKAFYEIPNDTS